MIGDVAKGFMKFQDPTFWEIEVRCFRSFEAKRRFFGVGSPPKIL